MYSRLLLRLDSIIGVNTLLQQEVGAYVTAVVPIENSIRHWIHAQSVSN